MLKVHLLWKVSMTSILVTNIECEKPTAHEICSYIDSSGYASGPIRRCLFIDYIIIYDLPKKYKTAPTGQINRLKDGSFEHQKCLSDGF